MTKIDTLTPSSQEKLVRFCADEGGATAIEYAMIASGIGGVIAVMVFALGGNVNNLYTAVAGLFP